jgi:hypothetical protein
MNAFQYALCVKFTDVNSAQIVEAARKNKVALLDIENYNSKKDYTKIFEEYILDIPQGSKIFLMFLFPSGESILTDKENLEPAFKKFNNLILWK